jgi:hypothetical protein
VSLSINKVCFKNKRVYNFRQQGLAGEEVTGSPIAGLASRQASPLSIVSHLIQKYNIKETNNII